MAKHLKGQCTACGGEIEFPAEAAGETADCPLCGQPTDLQLAAPPQEPVVRTATIVYTAIAVVILIGGLVGMMILQKRVKRMTDKNAPVPASKPSAPAPPNPFAEVAFQASPVTLEKPAGSALMYAVGSIRSLTNRQRFAVKVELDIFDADGQRLSQDANRPTDYQSVIEPNGEWHFRAQVLEKKASSAKLVSIKEQP